MLSLDGPMEHGIAGRVRYGKAVETSLEEEVEAPVGGEEVLEVLSVGDEVFCDEEEKLIRTAEEVH